MEWLAQILCEADDLENIQPVRGIQAEGRQFCQSPSKWEPNWQQERLDKHTWLAMARLSQRVPAIFAK